MTTDHFTAFLALELDRWPIPVVAPLASDATDDIKFLVLALPDGSLGVRVTRSGKDEHYETDVLLPEQIFKVVLSLRYAPGMLEVNVNGAEVRTFVAGSQQKQQCRFPSGLPAVSRGVVTREPITLSRFVPESATDTEALFVRIIFDLNEASESNDWYTLLRSSGPLRLLLLDGLLSKANARHRVNLEFYVPVPSSPPISDYDKHWHPVAPFGLAIEHVTHVGLDRFLKLPVLDSKEGSVVIRDVIRAAANADGGVHHGLPKHPAEELILQLDHSTTRMGQTASRQVLKDICAVVVRATTPLLQRIQRPDGG